MSFDLLSVSESWFESQGISYSSFDEIDSTTFIAKSEAQALAETLKVYSTTYQTAGRGRGDNSWKAKKGDAFLSSWSFSAPSSPQPILSPLVGLALLRALQKAWPQATLSLKAPNDIFLRDKKMLGILLEVVEGATRRLVVSFGFNVFGSPNEISTATSLTSSTSVTKESWQTFLSNVVIELQRAIKAGSLRELATSDCNELCKALNSNPNLLEKFEGVEADGSLVTLTKKIRWQDL